MDAGLPYDSPRPSDPRTLPDEAAPSPGADSAMGSVAGEPDGLDRPLGELPEHVTALLDRMSQGKVYLLEESPAVIRANAKTERVRGDARIADLAMQLDIQDPTAWLEAVTSAAPSPVRPLALYVESELIKHLSTAKVFSWCTGLGASPLGIEWLNDTTLLLIFSTSADALLGLSMLAAGGFDPEEGDDPLLPRAAHAIPLHLLPAASPPLPGAADTTEPSDPEQPGPSSAPTDPDAEAVVRRGRGTFASGLLSADHDAPLDSIRLKEGVDPNAPVEIRYAVGADKARRAKAEQSEWYRSHGRHAGKERAAVVRPPREEEEDEGRYALALRWTDASHGKEQHGRDFAARVEKKRKARWGPYERGIGGGEVDSGWGGSERGGGRGSRRGSQRQRGPEADLDSLDRELEDLRRSRENGDEGGMGMEVDGWGWEEERGRTREARGRRRGGGGGRREERGKEDLDRELDSLVAARQEAV